MMIDPGRRREQDSQLAWLESVLKDLQRRGWFGTVTIVLEEGMVKRLKREESLLPPKG